MKARLLTPRLLALFAAAALLLNFPLLLLWPGAVALFVLWAGVIGVLAWLMERAPHGERTPPDEGEP